MAYAEPHLIVIIYYMTFKTVSELEPCFSKLTMSYFWLCDICSKDLGHPKIYVIC